MRTTHSQTGNSFRGLVALLSIFLSALSFAVPSQAATTAASKVTFEDGLLSVDFTAVRAASAFAEVAKVAGIMVELPETLCEKPLTLTLASAHPDDAVRQMLRLLSVSNYAELFGRDGRARYIVLGANEGSRRSIGQPKANHPEPSSDASAASDDEAGTSEEPAVELATRAFADDVPAVQQTEPELGLSIND